MVASKQVHSVVAHWKLGDSEGECLSMHCDVSSERLPSYMKSSQQVLERVAGKEGQYFLVYSLQNGVFCCGIIVKKKKKKARPVFQFVNRELNLCKAHYLQGCV